MRKCCLRLGTWGKITKASHSKCSLWMLRYWVGDVQFAFVPGTGQSGVRKRMFVNKDACATTHHHNNVNIITLIACFITSFFPTLHSLSPALPLYKPPLFL
uniref:Uncharacterized protein n=1 Tax=Rhipicephalus zambeziensis TaxID=60191 RepID=A0A224YHY8_9ACAR